MQTLAENLLRICCFLLKIVGLLFVFLIVGNLILMYSGVTTLQGEVLLFGGYDPQDLIRMGLSMMIFYLPLCCFVKSLFPRREKSVVLIFYLFIAIASIPIFPENIVELDRAKESEAKHYIASMNRVQEAHFAEKSAFATSVDALGIGIKTETTNYKYSVRATKKAAFNYGISKQEKVRSHVGGVFVIGVNSNNAKNKITTKSILCRSDEPGTITPLPPTIQNDKLVCETGTIEVTK